MKFSTIFENVQQAKALLTKLEIPVTDPDYQEIRKMLSGHDGYTYWFCKLRFVDKVQLSELQRVWDTISQNENLIPFFSKPIVQLENLEKFWDEINAAQLRHKAKSVLDQFPHLQKSFFDLKNQEDLILLDRLFNNKSLPSLIKKISSFKDKKSFLEAANRLLNHKVSASFSELKQRIENTGAIIKFAEEEEDMIICEVNYKQLRNLGGDTSWCIVGSEPTFDSYRGSAGKQWIVFLLDFVDKGRGNALSKIGITTEFDYVTAHDKYDGHIDKNRLVGILASRGFNFNDLLIGKKELYAMPNWDGISVGNLMSREIPKEDIINRKNVFRLDYGYRGGSYKKDLEYFTKEEIVKYQLDDRSELDITQLRKMDKEYIIQKRCIARLVHRTNLAEVMKLGFTKEEIIEHKLFLQCHIDAPTLPLFTKKELIDYGILKSAKGIPLDTLFAIGFDKKEILSKYADNLEPQIKAILDFYKGMTKKQILNKHMWSDDWKKMNVGDSSRASTYLKILILFDITPKDAPLIPIKKGEKSLERFIELESKHKNWANITFIKGLYNIGYKIEDSTTLKVFMDMLHLNTNRGVYYIGMMEFYDTLKSFDEIGAKIIYDYAVDYIDNKIIQKTPTKEKDYHSNWGNSIINGMQYNAINIDLKLSYLEEIRDSISKGHPEIWKKIYDKAREGILVKPDELRTQRKGNESYGEYDIDETIKFFKFFNLKKADFDNFYRSEDRFLKMIESIFRNTALYKIDKVFEFLEGIGFQFTDSQKVEIISKLLSSSDKDKITHYQYLISKNLDVDASYQKIIGKLKEMNSITGPEWEKGIYKSFETPEGEKYKEELNKIFDNIGKREFFYKIRKELVDIFGRGNQYASDKSKLIQRWYDTYFEDYVKTQNLFPETGQGYYSNRWSDDFKVLLCLAKLHKLNELDDKIKIWYKPKPGWSIGHYESFDSGIVHTLAKIINNAGSKARDYRESIGFTPEDRKYIYDWLVTKVDETDKNTAKHLQTCYYQFDKPKFEKYLELVKVSKNNVGRYITSRSTKEDKWKPFTNRIQDLRYVLSYLAQMGQLDEFKRIVMTIFNYKMSPGEFERFIRTLADIRIDSYNDLDGEKTFKEKDVYSLYTMRKKSYDVFRNNLVEELKDLQEKKLLAKSAPKVKPVKESRIFSWLEFRPK